eukprot:3027008-Rhodomonas_salina.1
MRPLGQGHGLVFTTRSRSALWTVPQRPSTEGQYPITTETVLRVLSEASRVGQATLLRRDRRSLAVYHQPDSSWSDSSTPIARERDKVWG